MITRLLIFLAIYSVCCNTLAQKSYDHGNVLYPIPTVGQTYIDIQYIEINKNDFLLSEIRKYIMEEEKGDSLFKSGFGFVIVDNIKISPKEPYFIRQKKADENIIDYEFRLGVRSYLLTQKLSNTGSYCPGCFPNYYSIVENRLILLYVNESAWINRSFYSEASKIKLINLQKECLKGALRPGFKFIDIFGRQYQLDNNERTKLEEEDILLNASNTLQQSRKVIYYFDGRVKYE